MNHTKSVRDYLLTLQNKISAKIQEQEAISFQADKWDRPEGGGGESRILEGGATFEKAGINFSDVQGDHLPKSATNTRPHLEGAQFRAMGISLVLHPRNPFVPTTHMNVRFFSAKSKTKDTVWWFGGGYDLTPYYGFDEDAVHWHQTAKAACDPFGENLYKTFKENCDRYFFFLTEMNPGASAVYFLTTTIR